MKFQPEVMGTPNCSLLRALPTPPPNSNPHPCLQGVKEHPGVGLGEGAMLPRNLNSPNVISSTAPF